MIQQFIDFISKPWLGSILGVIGLAAAIVFYLRSRKRTRLAFQHDEVSVVGGGSAIFPSELEIRFADEIVPRVTSDRIVFWNAGNTTIGGSQIVDSDPLRIKLPAGESILKASVIKVSREVNSCKVVPTAQSGSSANIEFDFLDPGDGLSFEILHTGARHAAELVGTVRGMPSGIVDYGRLSWFSDRRLSNLPFPFSSIGRRIPLFVTLAFGIGMIAFGLFRPQIEEWSESRKPETEEPTEPFPSWLIVVGGVVYAGMPAAMLWMRRRRYPSVLELDDTKTEPSETKAAEQDVADQRPASGESKAP